MRSKWKSIHKLGIKELELFTIKIGYSLLVISSNYYFGWGTLRWRAGIQLRVAAAEPAAGDLPPRTCSAAHLRSRCAGCGGPAVPPCYRWRPTAGDLPLGTCRRGPAVPLACCAAHLRSRRATAGELPPCCAGNLPPGTSCAANLAPNLLPGAGLFCEAYGAGFADYGYLYLARVNHLVLNLLCYICRELLGLFV